MAASKAVGVNVQHGIAVGDILHTFTRDGGRVCSNDYKVLAVARNKVTVAFVYNGTDGKTCEGSEHETRIVRRSTSDSEFSNEGYFVSVREGGEWVRATQRKYVADGIWSGHWEDSNTVG